MAETRPTPKDVAEALVAFDVYLALDLVGTIERFALDPNMPDADERRSDRRALADEIVAASGWARYTPRPPG